LAQFVELNEDGTIKEGGILHSSTVSLEFIEDKKIKKEFIGKKKGDKLVVDPAKVSRGEKDTASMLGIKEEDLSTISNKFQLTINEVKHMELADLTQEFYDRLFGPGAMTSERIFARELQKILKGCSQMTLIVF
jgi:trigger factor